MGQARIAQIVEQRAASILAADGGTSRIEQAVKVEAGLLLALGAGSLL